MAADPLAELAAEVGPDGPVRVVGGRTSWDVGGTAPDGVREVRAPVGVVSFEPSEMVVRVRAGTPVEELDAALAPAGQCVALPLRPGSTVGGSLAVGRSGIDALGRGPVRDVLLEARFVDAWGRPARAGAPVVKNVSGYDLCRLLVGSLGTLGLLGEVVLRTRPRPAATRWVGGAVAVEEVWGAVRRPTAVLWDGSEVRVLLEGHPADVERQAATLAARGCAEMPGPPELPPVRTSIPPAAVWDLPARLAGERFVAEVGVGVVHRERPADPGAVPPRLVALHRAVKERLDPDGRLNPGRDPSGHGAVGDGC